MLPFGEAVLVWRVSRLVLTCTCLRRARHEALSSQFGLTLTSTCLGLGLINLVFMEWSRYTPSLRTGNVLLLFLLLPEIITGYWLQTIAASPLWVNQDQLVKISHLDWYHKCEAAIVGSQLPGLSSWYVIKPFMTISRIVQAAQEQRPNPESPRQMKESVRPPFQCLCYSVNHSVSSSHSVC
jgi:hypothetical protein